MVDAVPQGLSARDQLRVWLAKERREYADSKYDEQDENHRRLMLDMQNLGITEYSEHWGFITNYLKRAQLLGLDNPLGRQALGKTIVTLMHTLERAIEVFGPLPEAGYPSGELH